jgi:hypothetical protein
MYDPGNSIRVISLDGEILGEIVSVARRSSTGHTTYVVRPRWFKAGHSSQDILQRLANPNGSRGWCDWTGRDRIVAGESPGAQDLRLIG